MKELIELNPMSNTATLWSLGLAILAILPGLFIGWLALTSAKTNVELGTDSLRVEGLVFGRSFKYEDLLLGEAVHVDLANDDDYRLAVRVGGIGMPGYNKGWFRLGNGREAYVHIGGGKKALYIPTKDRSSLLLGLDDPDALLSKIKGRSSAS